MVKSLVWFGPIKLTSCILLECPAKNIWFLNISTNLKLEVPVALTTLVLKEVFNICGLDVPVVITILSVPSKLNNLCS